MIYLVTDSTAYLTKKEARDLKVLVVPMHYIKGGRETFQEGFVEDWQPGQAGDLADCTTAQAPTSAFMDLFGQLKAQGHQALCITISSRLSGTYANALKASEEVGEGILVLDSRTTAGAQYLLLREARRLIDGGADLQTCFDSLRAMRKQTRTIFTIQDMEPLRRSGRLGIVRSSVSTLLNLRPLLALQDGSVVSHALARGKQDQLRQMVVGLSGRPEEAVVQYAGEEDAADALAQRLKDQGVKVIKRRIGIVLGIHLGLPILSLAWIDKENHAA